jgi:adenosylcobinamide-GDP ribazoletransferase
MRLYFIALQFLTIVPLPFGVRCDEKDMGRAMAFFPLAGLTIGLLLVGVDFVVGRLFPRPVTDLLLLVTLAVVTGALHLDGLADVCDGLAARGGRERFLAVMKDSRTGAVGVVGLVLGLLLKYEALLQVPGDMKRGALLLFPMVARYGQVQTAVGAKSARQDGLGASFVASAGSFQLLAAVAVTLSLSWLILGVRGLWPFLAVSLLTGFLRWWFHRRLGGVTGDVIGCISELNEILCLLVLVALSGV